MVTPDLEENIRLLSTLIALGFSDPDLMLFFMPAIKIYGTTYKILGIKYLVFFNGCSRKVAKSLVIDIQADYNLLFGKSWVEELVDDPSYFAPKGLNPKDVLIRETMALRQWEWEALYDYFLKWVGVANRIQPKLPGGKMVRIFLPILNKTYNNFSMFSSSTWDQIWDRASLYYGGDLLGDDDDDHWERSCKCIFDWVYA